MRVSYGPGYFVPLPPGHAFPMSKFPALYKILIDEDLIRERDVVNPNPASWPDLRLVHSQTYLYKLVSGSQSQTERRKMGLPWTQFLVRRSRMAVQGTINAVRMALEDGIAASLAGGTHHAFPSHAEGFCVLNDVGVAIRVLKRDELIKRALVIDLDVHQGNGVAAIFADDPDVYTFSMHGARNYPWYKVPSSRDVALEDGTEDSHYLSVLGDHLAAVFEAARPDLVLYLAGVDVVRGDRFGRLALTPEGLYARDRYVLETVKRYGVPVTLLLSGGYAATAYETADLHAQAHRAAQDVFE
ncbi:MAG: histone deacetylase [Chloroflexi bacterium]|nr:histone deacetylase [Chloroflexota bacterium]